MVVAIGFVRRVPGQGEIEVMLALRESRDLLQQNRVIAGLMHMHITNRLPAARFG